MPTATFAGRGWINGVVIGLLLVGRWATGFVGASWLLVWMPLWYLSYTEGFLRRAFVGTFIMPFVVGLPLAQAEALVRQSALLAAFALLLLLTWQLQGMPRLTLFAFVVSDALPWLARNLGNLDTWVTFAVLAAIEAIDRPNAAAATGRRKVPVIAPLLCVIVPLIHEGGLWLLLPMLGGIWRLRPELRRRAGLAGAAALLAAAALWLFSTTQFSWPAGMPPELRDDPGMPKWIALFLGQSPHFYWPPCQTCTTPAWRIGVFSGLPCIAIVADVWRRAGGRAGAVVAFAIAATWSICLITSDTDRLMAWGPFTAVIVARAVPQTRRPLRKEDAGIKQTITEGRAADGTRRVGMLRWLHS